MENRIDFEKQGGLVPAIAQDVHTGEVLMLAYMDQEAVEKTLETGWAHYHSRSRDSLWKKGETSGHTQRVVSVRLDCDRDALLLLVEQTGPACHTGSRSCFFSSLQEGEADCPDPEILFRLRDVIHERREHPKEGSYTNYLFEKGIDKILKKVGEESSEVIIAAKNDGTGELRYETADLLYHLLVLLEEKELGFEEVLSELRSRRGSQS
ncbi:MAG: bifunctional phosphoribosyl-AMP cyclohydrolase/phosphoribosyl-ATP diphosphatase HisIE [Clostridia bacterium]|nr:bifunctional phosphoribosyl-AMP cyclohydrolase/phosphoribosyl-ATP diphosphatase HisIE [Clostridia bacterium]